MRVDRIWRDARLATMSGGGAIIAPGAIACRDGRIVYAGPEAKMPALDAAEVVACDGRWITPGLIDCHTHLVHAGHRAGEFARRLAGASYAEIAQAGGGIASSIAATRAADGAALIAQSLPRLDALLAEGVTTIEIKSGYGQDLATERRQLQAARALAGQRPVRVRTTFLGAHARPPEAADNDTYIDRLCDTILPGIEADAIDGFCEHIAFSPDQIRRFFTASPLPRHLHADQLCDGGGAGLAAELGALSADHLEYASEAGLAAMARAGVVAVLLPGAWYFIRETKLPPIAAMREHGVAMAVATDCNPGTSPLTSLLLAMNMAATLFRMTVEECLLGVTRHAAAALGLAGEIGTLEAGKSCDLAIWNIEDPAELVYRMGCNPLHQRVFQGEAC